MAPITLTTHARLRMEERLFGLKDDSVIRDCRRHIYNMNKERGGHKYKIPGEIAHYILNEDLAIITILYRKTRRERLKNKYRIYHGIQWMNLSKDEIKEIIRGAQSRKDKARNLKKSKHVREANNPNIWSGF